MATGIVKFFNESKGKGSIVPDHGGPDLPFDRSRLMGVTSVAGGQRVEFAEIHGRFGTEASSVQPI